MKKPLVLISSFLVFCVLSLCKGETSDPKDHLNLSFTKTVSIKRYKNLKVHCEPYTVREGDWLWKILRDKYKIPYDQRRDFLHVLKGINPEIFDADKVYPGQKIYVPLKLEIAREQVTAPCRARDIEVSSPRSSSFYVKEHIVSPGQCLSGILIRIYKVPKRLVFPEYIKRFCDLNPTVKNPNLIRAYQRILVPVCRPSPRKECELAGKRSVEALPSGEIATAQGLPSPGGVKDKMDSIGAFFTDIGDRYSNKGDYHIPIPGGGEFTLDIASFPMLEMENGRKVVIDIGDELPVRIEKLIESSWKNYKFVNIRSDESMESVFSKLFSLSGYYSVTRRGKPIVLKDEMITTKIWADWIIIKDKESARRDSTLAVNIVGERGEAPPPAIKKYVERSGVRVVDFFLAGRKERGNDQKEALTSGEEETTTLNSSTNKELVPALLALINQPFTTNARLSLLKTSSIGLKMGITADISLRREDNDFIISLQDLPNDLVEILAENEFSILEIREGEHPTSVISRVLEFLGIEFSSSTLEFDTAQKGDPHNITVFVPGFLLQGSPSCKALLTKADLDENLSRFLREKGVRAVRY